MVVDGDLEGDEVHCSFVLLRSHQAWRDVGKSLCFLSLLLAVRLSSLLSSRY